ncbi:hypothetical protein LEP1GSC045_1441 [Leptospira interrogans serovar Pomona str. Kennewicki LC82-25]|nr:hypothetical protein LEP1GSC045_1441 [Leptospira interrogans serovar Pomona str. Kennewicki LC82-25]EMI65492.1 hypothetical protein LEP1GSC200_1665 [Leptospira interrogans serovar Pomona str. CSL10083]
MLQKVTNLGILNSSNVVSRNKNLFVNVGTTTLETISNPITKIVLDRTRKCMLRVKLS